MKLTLEIYSSQLELTSLESIELMDYRDFPYSTEGKTYDNGHRIIVTSERYENLPHYNVYRLWQSKNPDYLSIVNTLFHEMGHVTDWKRMPVLYSAAENTNDKEAMLPSLFWLEYLAEKRSAQFGCFNDESLCSDIAKSKWMINKCDLTTANTSNYFYLNKLLPYFLGKTVNISKRQRYLQQFVNPLVKEYVVVLGQEIYRLEQQVPFDDPAVLRGLYDIMNRYYKKILGRYGW